MYKINLCISLYKLNCLLLYCMNMQDEDEAKAENINDTKRSQNEDKIIESSKDIEISLILTR